jgi:hypothetical protein
MNRTHTPLVLVGLLAILLLPFRASAQDEKPSRRDNVVAHNKGLRFTLAPGVIVPTNGANAGFSLSGDVRFGIELGPIIVAPGARLGGYWPSGPNAYVLLGTLRVTVPVGPIGPYVLGGVGPGWVTSPERTDVAYVLGGGAMVHIGSRFGIGLEVTFQAITDTRFKAMFFGPSLLF